MIIEDTENNPPFFGAEITIDFEVELLNTMENEDGQFFALEIKGITEKPFEVEINVEDAGGDEEGPSPGDVFRTLMKMLKDYVCPHCL